MERGSLLVALMMVMVSSARAQVFPLTTAVVGGRVVVVDSAGDRVKLACVNWYGAHMEGHVVNGLDRQSIENIANSIVSHGFNCVRLPSSLELLAGSLWHMG